MLQEKPAEIYVDNSSAIALTKNPIFHDRSKHIDIRFYYLKDCIANKKVEVKYVRTQDQVANIFTKLLKYDVFAKIRDILRFIRKSSLRGDVESKPDFSFFKE
jgi:hypothetical protein